MNDRAGALIAALSLTTAAPALADQAPVQRPASPPSQAAAQPASQHGAHGAMMSAQPGATMPAPGAPMDMSNCSCPCCQKMRQAAPAQPPAQPRR